MSEFSCQQCGQKFRHKLFFISHTHRVTCAEFNTTFASEPSLKYHIKVHHASSDEVNSKEEKSVKEEQAKDNSKQSAPVNESISRKGSIKENLPNDMTYEEETGNDPKQNDKDKSKSEGDEKHSTEKRGVYSETSKQESAHKTRRTEEIVARTFHDEIVPFKPNFNHHIATDHANTGNETIPEGWKSNDEESAFQPPGNSASPILSSA